MRFGELLRAFRLEKSTYSHAGLGRLIGKTRQYVRQIEAGECPPPTYLLCNKIAHHLKLDPREKVKFMDLAFQERIHLNQAFYDFLKQNLVSLYQESKPFIHSGDFRVFKLRYNIQWSSMDKALLDEPNIQTLLHDHIVSLLNKEEFYLKSLKIENGTVSVDLFMNSPHALDDLVLFLKHDSAEFLTELESCPYIDADKIWDHGFSIHSKELELS